jgi:hypothetical protein
MHGGEEEFTQGADGKARRRRDHQEDIHVGGRTTLKSILEKQDEIAWSGLIRLEIVTSGGFLRTR